MLVLLKYGGFATGGVNFDAKVRRESFEPVDLFHAHIGGMDAFARGLKIAAAIRADGRLDEIVKSRYAVGTRASAPRSKRARPTSSRSRSYMLEEGRRHAEHQRPAGDDREPDQYVHLKKRAEGGRQRAVMREIPIFRRGVLCFFAAGGISMPI